MSTEIITAALGSVIGDKVSEAIKKNKDVPQTVVVKSNANKLLKSRLARFISTSSTKTITPTGSITNVVDEDAIISNISIVVDSTFQTGGRLEIAVNGVEVFQDSAVGDWTDVSILDIPLGNEGKAIKRNDKIDFYLYGVGSITAYVQFQKEKLN